MGNPLLYPKRKEKSATARNEKQTKEANINVQARTKQDFILSHKHLLSWVSSFIVILLFKPDFTHYPSNNRIPPPSPPMPAAA
jgi:hypothetical protein